MNGRRFLPFERVAMASLVFFAQNAARADESGAPSGGDPQKEGSSTGTKKDEAGGDSRDPGAEKPEDKDPNAPKKRRSGLVLATTFGTGFVGMGGYPNDIAKLDNIQYYREGGVMLGGHIGGALMGAISPFVNVGFFGTYGSYADSNWKTTTVAGGVRLEVFPFAGIPHAEDLGISLATGLGTADLERKGSATGGASVSQSFVSLGAFYELRFLDLFGGHAIFAPGIQGDFTFGRTADARALSLAGRLAFYGGP